MTPTEALTTISKQTVSSLLEPQGSLDHTRRRELRLLLAETLGRNEAWVLSHGEALVPPQTASFFEKLKERRATGEPIAYLLGRREFFGRTFAVDRRVLIPRPETEHLIERALELELPDDARVLDIGTGSGCIAITLACERPGWSVVATDVSIAALEVAQSNASRLGVRDRIHFVATDLVRGVDLDPCHLVVSNPPYVELTAASQLPTDVRDFEPGLALFPEAGSPSVDPPTEADGLLAYRRLFADALPMTEGARVLLEIGLGQARAIERIATDAGFVVVASWKDLAGIERVLELERGTELAPEGESEEAAAAEA